jgi:predicted amidophosphoribosyltransferase
LRASPDLALTPDARLTPANYASLLLTPRAGPGVCAKCFNLIDEQQPCYACAHGRIVLDAVVPISYSVASEPLHRALYGYKRLPEPAAHRLRVVLAAILRRHLALHERCVAAAAGLQRFDLVTTVPSGDRYRDRAHPLREIVTSALGPTRHRHRRLLRRSAFHSGPRSPDFLKYLATHPLDGEAVLLIDDTWTTGANAQNAAAALKAAGAGSVAALAIGRHVNRDWHDNDRRLRTLTGQFRWSRCALCARSDLRTAADASLLDRARDAFPPRLAVSREQDVRVDPLDRVK